MPILKSLYSHDPALLYDDSLTFQQVADAFLVSCESENRSPGTIRMYSNEVVRLEEYLQSSGILLIRQVTADVIRRYLIHLSEGHNQGGVDLAYRVLKTLTYWWEEETGDYVSPLRRIKRKPPPFHPIQGVTKEQVDLIINRSHSMHKDRDKALVLFLFDTGVRSDELINLNVEDVDMQGRVEINHGKGNKYRQVFIGSSTRRALRAYLKDRQARLSDPLFLNDEGRRFKYPGLRQVLERRSIDAGVPVQSPHDFRRGFALECLRNGMDIYTLQRLMGHADLTTLLRYLRMTELDVASAYHKASPVDNMTTRR